MDNPRFRGYIKQPPRELTMTQERELTFKTNRAEVQNRFNNRPNEMNLACNDLKITAIQGKIGFLDSILRIRNVR